MDRMSPHYYSTPGKKKEGTATEGGATPKRHEQVIISHARHHLLKIKGTVFLPTFSPA